MSKPVDIKIAQFTKPNNLEQSIDSSLVWEIFQKNNNEVLKHFIKFQQTWVNQAYGIFKDFDTYLVLLYLINKVFLNLSDPEIDFTVSIFCKVSKSTVCFASPPFKELTAIFFNKGCTTTPTIITSGIIHKGTNTIEPPMA